MQNNTRKLILTRGIPGSGKSFWAKSYVAKDPEHRIRLNWDDMRNMMGPYWVPSREDINRQMLWTAIGAAMYCTNPYDIVIDNMNLNPKKWKEYEECVKAFNGSLHSEKTGIKYFLEFKDFWTPVEECIKRDSMRSNPIGEKTIKEIWRKYRNFIIQEDIKTMLSKQVPFNSDLQDCIIVDMDATLCFNTSGRPFYGEGAADKMIEDVPNNGVCEIVHAEKDRVNIIIITGRSESCRDTTERWLEKWSIPYNKLYMRNDGDYSKGDDYKRKVYEEYIKNKFNVLFVLDDSQKCVDMYRSLGLTVLQPNEGKF